MRERKRKIKRKFPQNVKQHINEARLISLKNIVILVPQLDTCALVNKMKTLHIWKFILLSSCFQFVCHSLLLNTVSEILWKTVGVFSQNTVFALLNTLLFPILWQINSGVRVFPNKPTYPFWLINMIKQLTNNCNSLVWKPLFVLDGVSFSSVEFQPFCFLF